ncbi:glycosyltransferase [Patescibacteria group bacterium]|nr:glycosyltransferase [Patescibacteria group bacterium]
MRISFFADNFYPELSGIPDSILITGKELVQRGHQVCYVAPHYGARDYEVVARALPQRPEYLEGMPVFRLPSIPLLRSPTGQSRIALPTGRSFSFLHAFKPDILHTHSPYGAGLEALRAAKMLRVPLVGTNHTPVEEFYRFAPNIARRLDAWYYNHCALITTPYQGLVSRMQEKGFKRPGRAMPNPLELSLFYPARNEEEREHLRAEMGLSGPVVIYSGRLASEKRVDVLLHAIKLLVPKFPSLTLLVTGLGIEAHSLHTLAQELDIEGRVRFTGFVPQDELARYYRAADVFAIMSTADSQSLSLMQAYATGIPAVCADSRGLHDYTPSDCGFLVEPGNHHTLAGKLKLLLNDSALRERMGKAAATFVKTFSPEKIVTEWEKIYRDAIVRNLSLKTASVQSG